MIFYRLLFGVAGLVGALFLFFFLWGLSDGTVSAYNMLLWLMILGGIGAILGFAMKLKAGANLLAACILLCVLALPGLLAGLFLLVVIVAQPRWN